MVAFNVLRSKSLNRAVGNQIRWSWRSALEIVEFDGQPSESRNRSVGTPGFEFIGRSSQSWRLTVHSCHWLISLSCL